MAECCANQKLHRCTYSYSKDGQWTAGPKRIHGSSLRLTTRNGTTNSYQIHHRTHHQTRINQALCVVHQHHTTFTFPRNSHLLIPRRCNRGRISLGTHIITVVSSTTRPLRSICVHTSSNTALISVCVVGKRRKAG